VGECFFWYRPTRVVLDQRPSNGRCCVPDRQQSRLIFVSTMNAVVTRINSMQRPTLGGGRLSGGFGVNCERGAALFVDVTGGTGNWLVTYRQRQRRNYFHSKTDSGKSGILRLIYCIKPKTKKWKKRTNTHTHIRLTALFPGLPGDPIWILVKQETVSGSGIRWAICKSAPRSRQTTTPAPHHSVFYRPDALPAAQPTASKH